MYFGSLNELWTMAGHGAFVWAAFAISFIVLAGLIILPVKHYRQQLLHIRQQQSEDI